MKKRITSIFVLLAVFIPLCPAAMAVSELPSVGEGVCGFKTVQRRESSVYNAEIVLFEHEKTGGRFLFVSNDDTNRTFDIAFKTPANDTGVSHIFEHTALGGSKKYPADLMFTLSSQTVNTYMNAHTYMNATSYPCSSVSDAQLLKLADYYLDGVFHPLITEDKSIFDREAWRYELADANGELTLNGTVYSEMKGSFTPFSRAYFNTLSTLYPRSTGSQTAGGDPEVIPLLSYEELKDYHKEYYIPSNALITLYGKADYKEYLKLADEYFSQYDRKTADFSDKEYEPVEGLARGLYTIPGTDPMQATVIYAIACPAKSREDYFALQLLAGVLASDGSGLSEAVKKSLPGAGFSVSINAYATEPTILFSTQNISRFGALSFKSVIDSALSEIAEKGFSKELTDAFAASAKRNALLTTENSSSSNIGVSMLGTLNQLWAYTSDPMAYFDYADYLTELDRHINSGELENAVKTYLLSPEKSALVTNVNEPNFSEVRSEALKKRLKQEKELMSEEEIRELVEKTNNPQKTDDGGLAKSLAAYLNVSSKEELRAELSNYAEPEYEVKDERINGVRFLSSETSGKGIGKARIYLDISQLSTKQLLYFELYDNLIGKLPTRTSSAAQAGNKALRYLTNDTKLLAAPEALYYMLSWYPLNEDARITYDVLYELLFETKFEDAKEISSQARRLCTQFESNSSPYSLMLGRMMARFSDSAAYYSYMEGLDFYKFLRDVVNKLEDNPDEVLSELNRVQSLIKNSYNASVIYAGDREGLEENDKGARAFFDKLPNSEHEGPSHEIPRPYDNEALIADSDVNYNFIFCGLDECGADRSGQLIVTERLVNNLFALPYLRHSKGAYTTLYSVNEQGMYIGTYRDPQIDSTYEFFSALPELLENTELGQEELDNYIMSAFAAYARKNGELDGAWNYLARLVYNSDADNMKRLEEFLQTTVEDVKGYAGVYRALWEKGAAATAGNASDIRENAHRFGIILNPFSIDEIRVFVNGKQLYTEVDLPNSDNALLVPARAVLEEIGFFVEWDNNLKTIIAKKGDNELLFSPNSDKAVFNGGEILLEAAVSVSSDTAMIPASVLEKLGFAVEYDKTSKTVNILSH
ncbi:MAG: insulinase family protein [Clostridiales bacterium]|nr:insulinase family protein [Clostridiales bacterium]